uniref:Uncharacterized protein n=1 Tax=Lactuca sativa TaxID=4236 RepID=A0A9R1VDE8_LACSA|nr:hypothetical protein LSAT_V11C500284970 [Lactuca sativa]
MDASQGVVVVHKFLLSYLLLLMLLRTDQLRDTQAEQIAYLIFIDELEIGTGLNQIGTLQRARDTRWSSHLKLVSSLIKMFSPACEVLLKIIEEGIGLIKGDADSIYETITTFDIIFVLHPNFTKKSQDNSNALNLDREIDMPNLSSAYFSRGARARNERSGYTLKHHYRVDIFMKPLIDN